MCQADGVQDSERLSVAESKVAGCFGNLTFIVSSVDDVHASIEESLNSYLSDTG